MYIKIIQLLVSKKDKCEKILGDINNKLLVPK